MIITQKLKIAQKKTHELKNPFQNIVHLLRVFFFHFWSVKTLENCEQNKKNLKIYFSFVSKHWSEWMELRGWNCSSWELYGWELCGVVVRLFSYICLHNIHTEEELFRGDYSLNHNWVMYIFFSSIKQSFGATWG